MKRDKFEELLHNKLAGTEVKPPADLWARLETQLPEIRRELVFGDHAGEPAAAGTLPAPNIRRPLRRKMKWAYVAASVAVVGVMVLSLRNLHDAAMVAEGPDEIKKEVLLPIVEPPVIEVEVHDVNPIGSIVNPSNNIYASSTTARKSVTTGIDIISRAGDDIPTSVDTDGDFPVSIPAKVNDGASTDASSAIGGTQTVERPVENHDNSGAGEQLSFEEFMARAIADDGKRSRRSGPINSASLYAANGTGVTGSGTVTGRTKLQKSNLIVNETTEYPGEETASSSALRSTEGLSLKHDLPIGFGASVNFGITNRLSVETGLTYTYMRSKGETVNTGARSVNTQKLHYLGLPVKIKYDFFQSRFIDLYASGGASLEKLVKGKVSSIDYYDDGRNIPQGTAKVKVGSLQTSVGANVGVSFNIDERFGIYAEPGVGYFFENSNQPESYRTEHPFNFTIKAGFRIKL